MDFSKITDILVEIMGYVFSLLASLGLKLPDNIIGGVQPRA